MAVSADFSTAQAVPCRLRILTAELLADLEAEGWRVADLLRTDSTSHLPHQWADICQPGNLQTVARALLLAWSEALDVIGATDATLPAHTLADTPDLSPSRAVCADDSLSLPDSFECLRPCPEGAWLVARRIHDWMVACALAAFAATLGAPQGMDTSVWTKRRREALESLPAPKSSRGVFAFSRHIPLIG